MLKILHVEDHPVVREGTKLLLRNAFDQLVVGEAGTGKQALESLRKEHWDVVILDLSLPDIPGLDVLKRAKRTKPGVPILVLSYYPEEMYGARVLKAGAAGYMHKGCPAMELIDAVHTVLQGGAHISPSLAAHMQAHADAPAKGALSDREIEVLSLLSQGETVSGIADTLRLSVKTASTYRARLLLKLNLRTTADLIRHAIEHRIQG